MAALLHQRHFRFADNAGTLTSPVWLQTLDTNHVTTSDGVFLLRFAVWEEGSPAGVASNTFQQFQCRLNGGTWQDITTTSSICKAVSTVVFTNGASCTPQQLGTHGSFDTSNAGCTTDGSSGGNTNDIPAGGASETMCALQLVTADLETGDVVEFRLTVTYNTSVTTIVYDVTPQVTVNDPSVSASRSGSASASLSPSLSPSPSPSGSPSASPSGSESRSGSRSPSVSPSGSGSQSASQSASFTPSQPTYGRPGTDLSAGTWTPSTGVSLSAMVNEEDPEDATYIRSGATPVDDTAKLRLTGLLLPGPGTVTLRIRGRWTP